MSVKVILPTFLHPSLRRSGRGYETVEIECRTVGECIERLEAKFPGIKKELCGIGGEFSPYYDLYVNLQTCYSDEMEHPVKDGDELTFSFIDGGG